VGPFRIGADSAATSAAPATGKRVVLCMVLACSTPLFQVKDGAEFYAGKLLSLHKRQNRLPQAGRRPHWKRMYDETVVGPVFTRQ
jgi:hypothetical protein